MANKKAIFGGLGALVASTIVGCVPANRDIGSFSPSTTGSSYDIPADPSTTAVGFEDIFTPILEITYEEWRGVIPNSEGGPEAEELLKRRGQYVIEHGDAVYDSLSDKDKEMYSGEFLKQIEEQMERAKISQQLEDLETMYITLTNLVNGENTPPSKRLRELGQLFEPNFQNIYSVDISFSNPEEITTGVKVLLYLDQKYAKRYHREEWERISND